MRMKIPIRIDLDANRRSQYGAPRPAAATTGRGMHGDARRPHRRVAQGLSSARAPARPFRGRGAARGGSAACPARGGRAARAGSGDRQRRALRPSRSERRREDHRHRDPDYPRARHRWDSGGRGNGGGPRSGGGQAPHRRRAAAAESGPRDAQAAAATARALPGVLSAQAERATLRAYAERAGEAIGPLVRAAEGNGRAVRDVHLSPPSLETLFVSLTGRRLE